MKKIVTKIIVILFMLLSINAFTQTLTGLKLDFKGAYDNSKAIYITPLPEDKLQAVDKLKFSLYSKGLKTASSIGEAEYLVTLSYKDRKDNGCKRTFKEMTGNIMDIKNSGGVVASIVFKQTDWEGNCVDAIMNDFADRLKGHQSTSSSKVKLVNTNLTMQDVYSATEFIFYGFDFSNFRFIDEEYLNKGAEIRDSYFPSWNSFPLTEIPIEKMQKWFDKSKIIYNPVIVTLMNTKVSVDNLVQKMPYTTSKEAIAETISKYDKPNNSTSKIGYVVNVEYFNKETKRTSAYVTFFDITTGAVISSENITNSDAGGKGLTTYWGKSLSFVLKNYYDEKYSKGQK